MRNKLLFGTAALALALTSVSAFASGNASVGPNIYDPAWQTSRDVQAPHAVLGAYSGTYQTDDAAAVQHPRYGR